MTSEPPGRVCPSCGRSIPAEAAFCPHCGERRGRSALETVVDWFVTALVVVLVVLFGLMAACFLLAGVGSIGQLRRYPGWFVAVLVLMSLGIGLLMAARSLIQYLRRRRQRVRAGTPPAPPTGGR